MTTADLPRVLVVAGARPNFMKIAPILRALDARGESDQALLHSGQHYDEAMSASFFKDLAIPEPDFMLEVGSGTHGVQTAAALCGVEDVLLKGKWAMVVVVGDVNSTVGAALAAAKLGIPVTHVEAGLRSRDRAMPEELNRIVTDQLSDLCLTPSHDGDDNLRAEGIAEDRIVFIGNVMIDTLRYSLARMGTPRPPLDDLEAGNYVVVTMHRPSNVDDADQLQQILAALEVIAAEVPVVFPAHPRSRAAMERFGLSVERVRMIDPLGYSEMLCLQACAGLVMTDSGGMQEETTVLGVPCLTLRANTERPITITEGTNHLVPVRSTEAIVEAFHRHWGTPVEPQIPEGWDGMAGERAAEAILARCV